MNCNIREMEAYKIMVPGKNYMFNYHNKAGECKQYRGEMLEVKADKLFFHDEVAGHTKSLFVTEIHTVKELP